MNWGEFQKWVACLCMWREARGEGHDGLRAVCHVIANRSLKHGKSWAEVVFQWKQFSSMTTPGDPQLTKVPLAPDPVFEDCYAIADQVYYGKDDDLTKGATHYFADSIPMPEWAKNMIPTGKIGKHNFFREE
jgi:N-acetylmuramoyl-L-alanine amidase